MSNFIDKKDEEIARLKLAITKFKEYDEQRKEYYKFLVEDWQHSDSRHIIEGLRLKIKEQKKVIGNLSKKVQALVELSKLTDDEINVILKNPNAVISKVENKSLKNRIKEQRDTINDLIYKLNNLK